MLSVVFVRWARFRFRASSGFVYVIPRALRLRGPCRVWSTWLVGSVRAPGGVGGAVVLAALWEGDLWCPDNDSSRCRGEVTGPTHGPRAGRVRADCETAPCPLPARALPALDEICPRSARALSWALTCALARAFGHLPADSLLLRISPPPGSAAPLVRSPLSALSSSRASSLVTQPRSRTLI